MKRPNAIADDYAEPTWDIAELFPAQGSWSEDEYLALDTNRLVEFSHGHLEILPMPTQSHQLLVIALFQLLRAFVAARKLGTALIAPMRMQLWPGKFREPDIMLMLAENDERRTDQYWLGADLVMEVVSPDDRRRDLVTKRNEYAMAGIPEYWIVDPTDRQITVLALEGNSYTVHGAFAEGEQATSLLLEGFSVDVTTVFAELE
jgi:Uma2 family endonuclease